MNKSKLTFLTLTLLLGISSCAPQPESSASPHPDDQQSAHTATGPSLTVLPAPERLIAIGDLHGDFDATRRAFRLAGAIDAQDNWSGGKLTVVQVGDQLDRGDGERAILALLDRLIPQAEAAGGKLYVLNGNHEIMNAQGDLRYVTERGFQEFIGMPGLKLDLPQLAQLPELVRPRAAAFFPGGPFALMLAKRPIALQLGETVFVHGGLLPNHVDYGLNKLNQESQDWLAGKSATFPLLLAEETGPIWTRAYSDPTVAPDCAALNQTLTKLNAKRMIVGHSVHPKVNSACENKVWRVDVGMSRAYGGPVEILEIQGEQTKVLSESSAAKIPAVKN